MGLASWQDPRQTGPPPRAPANGRLGFVAERFCCLSKTIKSAERFYCFTKTIKSFRPSFPFGFLGAGGRLPKARRGHFFIAQFTAIIRTHDKQGTGPGNGPRRPEDLGHETQDPRPKGKRQKTSVYVCGVGSTAFKHTVGPKSIAAPECPGTGTAPIAPCAPTHQKSTKRNGRA